MSCRGGNPPQSAAEANAPNASASPPSATTTAKAPAVPTDLLLPSMPTGTSAATTSAPLPPVGQRPPCAKDEDCWSSTCCPATKAEQCVHGSLAQKCAIVDVTCPKGDVRFDCVCVAGQCDGRLHP
jgi:hypothetical protein